MEIFQYYAFLLRFWKLWVVLFAGFFIYGLGVNSGLAWNIFTSPREQLDNPVTPAKKPSSSSRSSATSAASAVTASAEPSEPPIDIEPWVATGRRKPLVAPAPLPSTTAREDAPERRRPLRPAGGGQ